MSEMVRGGGPIIPMIDGIDAAHRPLASLFFDDVRDEAGCVPDRAVEDQVSR